MLDGPGADLDFVSLSTFNHSSSEILFSRLSYILLLTFSKWLYTSFYLLGIFEARVFLLQNCFLKWFLTSSSTSSFWFTSTIFELSSFTILSITTRLEDLSSKLLIICLSSPCIALQHCSTAMLISSSFSFFLAC